MPKLPFPYPKRPPTWEPRPSFLFSRRRKSGPSGPTVLILDNFNGTDGTTLPDHAIAPTNTPAATWGAFSSLPACKIVSNAIVGSAGISGNILDVGVSQYAAIAYMTASTSRSDIIVRCVDVSNYFDIGFKIGGVDKIEIFETTGGGSSLRATFSGTLTTPGILRVENTSSEISVFFDGVLKVSYSSTAKNTATKLGVLADTAPVDYFMVENL